MAITIEAIRANACRATGLFDFGARHFEAPLARWVDDLNHPRLSATARRLFQNLIERDLARRLEVLDWLKRHPEIDDVVIPPILYISGHERSGTTFLHHLLNLHPRSRALLRWELMHPTPPPEAASYRTDPRIARTQASIDKLRGTALEQMHWIDADDPEECHWGLLNATSMLGGAAFVAMPSWSEWWTRHQSVDAFLEYRRLIKLLLWRNPPPEGGHLVLKCPQFATHLPALSRALPEARFILTHRDPYRVCTSLATLTAHINTPFFEQADLFASDGPLIGAVVEAAEYKVGRLVEFDRQSVGVVNVAYPDLVQNPPAVVEQIHARFGLASSPQLGEAIGAYVTAQKSGRRAKPPAELPTFGLSQMEFLSRPEIAGYCEHFGVEPERTRQTGA